MKRQTKLHEKQLIRLRDSLERKAITIAKKAIKQQYNYFLQKALKSDKSTWLQIAETIPEKPIEDLLYTIYPMNAKIASLVRKQLLSKKDLESDLYESVFTRQLTVILNTIAAEKVRTITSTSVDRIKGVIRNVLDDGERQGLGIQDIASNLYDEIGSNLRGNGYARARAIAQTEMISASNQASNFAANSTGYETRKFWSTSGLPNIRISHIEAEQFSDQKDGLKENETFPNGLLYPGDPNGPAEEVINCRCTIMHEIVW